MIKTLIELSDGSVLSSGAPGAAILSTELTQMVNDGNQLQLGSVCSAMLECKLLEAADVRIASGEKLTVYQLEGENKTLLGTFYAQTPVRKGTCTMILTAFDAVSLLDKDLSQWLRSLDRWPYSLYEFAGMVCQACGVLLANNGIPCGEQLLQPFRADAVSGRQLLSWVAEVAGRFVRATKTGEVEFAWYTPLDTYTLAPVPGEDRVEWGEEGICLSGDIAVTGDLALTASWLTLTDDGAGNVTLTAQPGTPRLMYFAGGLQLADQAVAPIQKVQLRQTQDDVGTVYPDDPESRNTYAITGNPLLPALSGNSLLPVAQTLYHQLKQVTYTPCTIEMPAGTVIQPGHILTVQDATGRQTQTWIMEKRRRGQKDTLVCVGSPLRENSGDANNRDFATLAGKVLHLRTDVDGIKAENRDTQGKLTCVELDLEGLRTKTERLDTLEDAQQTLSTQLTQTADKVEILVERTESGQAQQVTTSAGYSFSDAGLQIKRSGESVENLLTHEGMQVSRYGSPILRADKEGVRAVDVTVGNFLVMGDHARFEDYPVSRTACFYI